MSNYNFRQRRRGYRSRHLSDYGSTLFIAVLLIVMVISLVRVSIQWNDCSEKGGKMVQGLSTTGYVCVEGK